ncbi:uncharacterized protein LOC116841201 [Odontomachus brunneus]|uniref:uncharacterized protein LOC116841201 n=1 Tax=Odontomachus brunneus TaxID=486640 RepID=UPI0013F21F8A|nr:uncharacterized protein LOC116841201 [Odontomachus brunneus]XP_032664752.1 uncharacterized protein LOC116841201 [Odontomachus brunneus]
MDSSFEDILFDIKSELKEAEQEELSPLNRNQTLTLEDFQNLQSTTTNHQPSDIREDSTDQSESSDNYWDTNDLEITKVLSKTIKPRLESSYPTDRENEYLLQRSMVAIQKLHRILEYWEQNCYNYTSYSGDTDCTISQLQEPTYNRCSPQELDLQKTDSKIIHPLRNNPSFLNNRADNNLISASTFPRTSLSKIAAHSTFQKTINAMEELQCQLEQWKIRRKLAWTKHLKLRKTIQERIDQITAETLRLEKANVSLEQVLSNLFNEQPDNSAIENSETNTQLMIPTHTSCMMNPTSNNARSAPRKIKTNRKPQRKRKLSWTSSKLMIQNNTIRNNVVSASDFSETLLNSSTFHPIQTNMSTGIKSISSIPGSYKLKKQTNLRHNICDSESNENLNNISHMRSKKSLEEAMNFSHLKYNRYNRRDPITGRFISMTRSSKLN